MTLFPRRVIQAVMTAVLIAAMSSCREERIPVSNESFQSPAESQETKLARTSGCANPRTFDATGLPGLRVGMSVPEVKQSCDVRDDLVLDLEGKRRRVVHVNARVASILMYVERDTVREIRIDGAWFRGPGGISVGDAVNSLKAFGELQIERDDARRANVAASGLCGLRFRVDNSDILRIRLGRILGTDNLSPRGSIRSVRITGCSRPPAAST